MQSFKVGGVILCEIMPYFLFLARLKAIHFSWLGPELLVCCLAHRGPTGVFLLLQS